mmetsp:Transcript_9121/g.22481  ORF Transcript_9121/g.22481 Transcript_9121/m.22481 type:complete len:289 (+) Transcript_9121:248-1114(+)
MGCSSAHAPERGDLCLRVQNDQGAMYGAGGQAGDDVHGRHVSLLLLRVAHRPRPRPLRAPRVLHDGCDVFRGGVRYVRRVFKHLRPVYAGVLLDRDRWAARGPLDDAPFQPHPGACWHGDHDHERDDRRLVSRLPGLQRAGVVRLHTANALPRISRCPPPDLHHGSIHVADAEVRAAAHGPGEPWLARFGPLRQRPSRGGAGAGFVAAARSLLDAVALPAVPLVRGIHGPAAAARQLLHRDSGRPSGEGRNGTGWHLPHRDQGDVRGVRMDPAARWPHHDVPSGADFG